MLRDVSTVDTRTCVLGQEVAFPICVGATAMQRMAHIDGELATSRGTLNMHGYSQYQYILLLSLSLSLSLYCSLLSLSLSLSLYCSL